MTVAGYVHSVVDLLRSNNPYVCYMKPPAIVQHVLFHSHPPANPGVTHQNFMVTRVSFPSSS
jgi:hypothetical protein